MSTDFGSLNCGSTSRSWRFSEACGSEFEDVGNIVDTARKETAANTAEAVMAVMDDFSSTMVNGKLVWPIRILVMEDGMRVND